jgi:predicted HTH domain antitoxin
MGMESVVGKGADKTHSRSMKIEINVPDVTEEQAARDPDASRRVMVELACIMYQRNIISFGQAQKMTGLDVLEFQGELSLRSIPRMTLESFELETSDVGS